MGWLYVHIMTTMKTISVAVSESDYEAFRRAAQAQHRPIAQLIREAMENYRKDKLEQRAPLSDLPVLAGHSPLGPLPKRSTIYDEILNGERDTTK